MQSEVPCLVPADRLTRDRAAGKVTATPPQLRALAARLRVPSVSVFRFEYAFTPTLWRDVYRLEGRLEAELAQECVLTLEPVTSRVATPFSCLCGTAAALAGLEEREDLDPDEDPPEEITPNGIDVGELAIQYLSLALNDYPRRPDLALTDVLERVGRTQQDNRQSRDRQQPFTQLHDLLKPRKE